ncbi:hypothetical protein BHE74_00003750 [Ensete ventricosum]|nr:hypothetical protein BHE74_00003750 [Ensete ventricosum]
MTLVETLQAPARPLAFDESTEPPASLSSWTRHAQIARRSSTVGVSSLMSLTPLQHWSESDGSFPVTYGTHSPKAVCAIPQSECVSDDALSMAAARIATSNKRRAMRVKKQQYTRAEDHRAGSGFSWCQRVMGNCMERSAASQLEEEEEDMKAGKQDGEGVTEKEGSCKVKILLTKKELEWLVLHLKEKGEQRLEDVLEEMARELGRERGKAKGWQPTLESIVESSEVQTP